MKAFTITNVTIIFMAGTIWASQANAQVGTPGSRSQTAAPRPVEVTPFVSIDSRGGSPIGAAINFPIGTRFGLETEVGYRRGEGRLNAFSSSANLLYFLPRMGRTLPYLATGAGLAQYGAPIVSREGTVIGTAPRIRWEINAGGGLKVPVDDTWGMRTDARWFKSFGRHGSEHWRVSHGVSFDVRKR